MNMNSMTTCYFIAANAILPKPQTLSRHHRQRYPPQAANTIYPVVSTDAIPSPTQTLTPESTDAIPPKIQRKRYPPEVANAFPPKHSTLCGCLAYGRIDRNPCP